MACCRRNGCKDLTPVPTFSNQSTETNNSVSCHSYCEGMANVTLCTVDGGTHAWPGGRCGGELGACTLSIPGYATLHMAGEPLIHTSEEIWRFFQDKVLPNVS